MFLKSCRARPVFLGSVGVTHCLNHLPHFCNILPCSIKCRWAVSLLRWVKLTCLLCHAGQWEREAHAGSSRHGHAELGLLSWEWNVQRLLVDLETVTVWADALYLEALATNRPMGTLLCLWCWSWVWVSRSYTLFVCAVLL